ncbi:MAG: hypothetical protein EYC70_13075 [Planctomycetota bacterium]|nr:MAG: hypothetical protein EYC70_13075 [Planctomycetota bacterium]
MLLAALALLLSPQAPAYVPLRPAAGDSPFVQRYLEQAVRLRDEGKPEEARLAVERALERDDRHLGALRLLAEMSLALGDTDTAVYAWHRWLDVVDASDQPLVKGAERKAAREQLLLLDASADELRRLSDHYVAELLGIAQEHVKRKRFHSALAVYDEILIVDPLNVPARKGVVDVRRKGSADVATEDVYAGGDPTFGVSPEWVATEDAKHATWDAAWTKDGENYRYRTDAGFVVLQTSSIAMEQMNGFYRQFFRYKLDGDPTPKIEVRIFKDRDEYLKLGVGPPVEWSGGHFTGDAVETYVGGQTGRESIREMYGTLFHEAAHQFVSLTGKGGVPGWLNEAYASFFEGCTILSNGSVKWNQVPNHRLFPLAARLEKGWMRHSGDGVRDASGEWQDPENAPTFRIVVEGDYEWGPPWYAPTWGVVYFLYNYRDGEGQPVYRDALHAYYNSNASAHQGDAATHFESVVLADPRSPVQTLDELSELWRDWLLELRDVQIGKKEAGAGALEFGDAASGRGETDLAVQFYEEAYSHYAEDPEVLWKLATALEQQENLDRAAALYRDFSRELELRGLIGDARYPVAQKKMEELDPLFRRHAGLRKKLLEDGLALARSYRERELPTMALEVARRMSAQFSLPEALDFYSEVARATGKSLARWRVAYNELDLDGWSSSGGDGYRAYGNMIEGAVAPDPSTAAGTFVTRELTCDVTFDSDFSLEAEMRFEPGASLLGLCFGRKDATNTHAVVLHPKGFLDISTQNGGQWSVREHRQVHVDLDWQKLRVDVVGDTVDVYLNDRYIRSMQMPSRDSVRGGFGLITGVGTCYYQNIRLLARDPHDPAARIEREFAMQRIAESAEARQPGSFSGIAPPPLDVHTWIQGGPLPPLHELLGHPVVLIFWTPTQDKLIPVTQYYQHLAEAYGPFGFRFVALSNNQDAPAVIQSYLGEHPMPDVAVGWDGASKTYAAYNLRSGGFGLPRVLVVDVDGTVAWEGDPGLKIGVGWEPGAGATFVDGALADLAERRRLREIAALAPALESGRGHVAAGRWKEAMETLNPLADLDAPFDASVRAARALRQQVMEQGAAQLAEALQLRAAAPLRAHRLLAATAGDFAGTASGEQAAAGLKELEKDAAWKSAQKAWKVLERAAGLAERGRDAAALQPLLDEASAASGVAEIADLVARLRAALAERGSGGFLEVWRALP